MEGPDIYDNNMKGIIPRSVEAIFNGITKSDGSIEFSLKVSYIEIYMERIRYVYILYYARWNGMYSLVYWVYSMV